MLLIDVNSEKSIDIKTQDEDSGKKSVTDMYLGQTRRKNKNVASIHIGTLAQYTGHGSGDYALTVIKQMTGTKSFLAWPQDKRDCALEKYEKCQMKGFLEESMKCGCSPFQLLPAVGNNCQICSLAGTDCIQNLPSCGVACQGLYADVTKREVTDEKEQNDEEKLMRLKQEYERYKELWGLNLQYSHSAGPSQNYTEKKKVNLEVVHIFFDTSTFDQVERDVKVTLVAQLGVIGGTMGLFTGFSILGGIEIVYFAAKFFFGKMKSYESKASVA